MRAEARELHLVTTARNQAKTKSSETSPRNQTIEWHVGDRALIPASEWPDEKSAERDGQGWEVEIEDISHRPKGPPYALVSFVHARDPKGKQFERQRVTVSTLMALPKNNGANPDGFLDTTDTESTDEENNLEELSPKQSDSADSLSAPQPLKKIDTLRRSQRIRPVMTRFDPGSSVLSITPMRADHLNRQLKEESVAAVFDDWAPFDLRHQTDAGLLREAKQQTPLSVKDTKALAKELVWGPNRQHKVDEIEKCREKLERPGSSAADKADWVAALKRGGHDDLRLWSPPRKRRDVQLGGTHACEPPPPSCHQQREIRAPAQTNEIKSEHNVKSTIRSRCQSPPSNRMLGVARTVKEKACEDVQVLSAVKRCMEARDKLKEGNTHSQALSQRYTGSKKSRRDSLPTSQ